MMKAEIERLKEMIEKSDRVVFLGGAGVSTFTASYLATFPVGTLR
jgi:NAD-dependent SIR2 family protein deacetylase